MLPVLSREVIEGKQRVAILDQALDSLVVFDAPDFDEGVERGECILLGLGHPDLLERSLETSTAAARLEADETAKSAKNEIWLPFLDTYRTMCLAPQPDFRRVLEDVRAMQLAA
jgi:hypothetical protein